MSGTYHINPKTGAVGKCRASQGNCPFGGEGDHYTTREEAAIVYEKRMSAPFQAFAASQVAVSEKDRLLGEVRDERDALRRAIRDGESQEFEKLKELETSYIAATDTLRNTLYARNFAWQDAVTAGVVDPEEKPSNNTRESKESNAYYLRTMRARVSFAEKLKGGQRAALVSELSAWGNITEAEASDAIEAYEAHVKLAEADGEEPLSRDEYVVNLFQDNMDFQRERVFVDLETTGFHPTNAEIIEIGVVRVDPQGNVIERIDERFGLQDPQVLERLGTGPEEIHRISPADIRGRAPFTDPAVQKKYSALLADRSRVLIAHNANFENNFFNHYLAGYRDERYKESAHNLEQGREGAPLNDTRTIASMLLHTVKKNRLVDFVQANGMIYRDDAHNAGVDALMTAEVFEKFRRTVASQPRGKRPELTLPE